MKKLLAIVLVLAVLAGGGFALRSRFSGPPVPAVRFVSEAAVRADVVSTIAASGTLEPVELVDVGSQVSGQIVAFGTDRDGAEVDYCSTVTNGMVLARIDDETYLADLDVAKAQLANAEASVASANANMQKAKVDLDHARKDWDRARTIGVGIALSQSDYDSYLASYESACAQLVVAESSVRQAAAQVVQAKANVEKAARNLGYCTIVSPVDGIVVDRRVNLGQTVVSSMSASSLFLVAKDLHKMRIKVKRIRYVLQTVDVLRLPPSLVRQLKQVQDTLGFLHDDYVNDNWMDAARRLHPDDAALERQIQAFCEAQEGRVERSLEQVPVLWEDFLASLRDVLARHDGSGSRRRS